ncbi:MAG: PAS domain S-box protein [Syntrophales bacterium]|jgi:PAS domain S-box-containing protein
MSIRTKLLINVLLLVTSLLVIALVLNIARNEIADSVRRADFADRIVIGVSDMNAITYDYLMKPGERARRQWEMKHTSLDDLMKSAKFKRKEVIVIVQRIMKSHEDTALFFKQLVENSEKKKHASVSLRALLDENDERNVTQLMARSQIMASDSYLLARESEVTIQKALTWSVWFITITLVIMIVIIGAISFFLSRNITASINTLKAGTEIIARGDLEYRVPVRGRDEIASLSLSFNEMAGRLKDVDASLRGEIEEKEKAREALRIANLYTRSLIEVSLDPLVTISAAGRVMDVNKATEDVTGVPREKLIGSDFSDYFTEPGKAREGYSRVFSQGFVKDYPLAIRHTSGRITEVLYNAATYKNDKGEIQGVFAAARDITALRAAQNALRKSYDELEHRVEERTAELRESEERLTHALEAGELGIWGLDTKTGKAWRSLRHDQVFGYDKILPEWTYQMFLAHVLPLDRKEVDEKFGHATSIGTEWNFECRIRRTDGAIRWIWAQGMPRLNERNEVVSMVGLVRDITGRKQTEAETERLATFPRLNPNPIVETDMAGNVQFVNPAADRLFPDIREHGLAHPWLADWEALVRTCREGGKEANVREVTADGRWYLQTISFVREVKRIRIYGLDITERRTAELELKERTVQLEAANKELEGFSYSVSHDLRAPLRAIDGFSMRLIRDFGDKLEEDGVRKLHAISRNAQQMGQLIDDLLSFSRLSRKEMHMSRVNMEAMARDVWREIKESNPNRELDFRIVNMIPLFGDASLIRQVVVNLLSNAVKFTRDRKPAVIETGSRKEGSEITYYVKDNGAGFDMRYSDKLFGVFERLHRPDEFEGTGVGLAIVQRIIHRHGGRVWADGKVNGGATFNFTVAGKEKNIA